MLESFAISPEQASTIAGRIDALFWFLNGITIFFSALIFVLVVGFVFKYRRGSKADRSGNRYPDPRLEIVWIVVPFVITMVIFFWAAVLFFELQRVPPGGLEVYAVGKQWMWKFQHPNGRREINTLHVPTGRVVQLTMVSQDVIHSVFIPAFRVKQDVLPGRYTTLWFEATKPGEYHLFCTEYCGTKHSAMIGKVVVMEPSRYEAWLASEPVGETIAASGERVFLQAGCSGCHGPASDVAAPRLEGLYRSQVKLEGGRTVVADERYLRDSILLPQTEVVAGYKPIMPTYQNVLAEEQVLQLIAYLKSLGPTERKRTE